MTMNFEESIGINEYTLVFGDLSIPVMRCQETVDLRRNLIAVDIEVDDIELKTLNMTLAELGGKLIEYARDEKNSVQVFKNKEVEPMVSFEGYEMNRISRAIGQDAVYSFPYFTIVLQKNVINR